MNQDEIVTLLQIITAYDGRTIDNVSIMAWTQAAQRQHWTFDEAAAAVHEHYSASPAWLMPGHVTQLVRRGGAGALWQE